MLSATCTKSDRNVRTVIQADSLAKVFWRERKRFFSLIKEKRKGFDFRRSLVHFNNDNRTKSFKNFCNTFRD